MSWISDIRPLYPLTVTLLRRVEPVTRVLAPDGARTQDRAFRVRTVLLVRERLCFQCEARERAVYVAMPPGLPGQLLAAVELQPRAVGLDGEPASAGRFGDLGHDPRGGAGLAARLVA